MALCRKGKTVGMILTMTDKIALRQNLYSSLAQLLMGHFALDVSWTISRVQAFHLACVCDTVHTGVMRSTLCVWLVCGCMGQILYQWGVDLSYQPPSRACGRPLGAITCTLAPGMLHHRPHLFRLHSILAWPTLHHLHSMAYTVSPTLYGLHSKACILYDLRQH